MVPYLILLILVLVFANIYDRTPISDNKNLIFWLIIIVLSIFAGLRDSSVGTDTGGYCREFMQFEDREYVVSWRTFLSEEGGFYLLNKILSLFSNQYWLYLTAVAFIVYSCILSSLKRNTVNFTISLFFFITLGYYTFSFNAARQGIASAIFMLSYKYILDKKFLKYAIVVCVAALFHKTVIVAIPLYFLFARKYSLKNVVFIFIVGIVSSILMGPMLQYTASLNDKYAIYVEENARGGELLTIFYVFLAFFFVWHRKFIHKERLLWYDVCLNLILCATAIYLTVLIGGLYVELTRFAAYFQLASVFLWAELFNSRTPKLSPFFKGSIFLCGIIFFCIFVWKMAGLMPYIFNNELFKIR